METNKLEIFVMEGDHPLLSSPPLAVGLASWNREVNTTLNYEELKSGENVRNLNKMRRPDSWQLYDVPIASLINVALQQKKLNRKVDNKEQSSAPHFRFLDFFCSRNNFHTFVTAVVGKVQMKCLRLFILLVVAHQARTRRAEAGNQLSLQLTCHVARPLYLAAEAGAGCRRRAEGWRARSGPGWRPGWRGRSGSGPGVRSGSGWGASSSCPQCRTPQAPAQGWNDNNIHYVYQ